MTPISETCTHHTDDDPSDVQGGQSNARFPPDTSVFTFLNGSFQRELYLFIFFFPTFTPARSFSRSKFRLGGLVESSENSSIFRPVPDVSLEKS